MNILVTGASKGIGFEIVKQFSSTAGNNIIALSRDMELLQNLQIICNNECNNNIHIYSIDFLGITFEDELKSILSNHNFHIDIVINNAGYLVNKPFTETSQEEIRQIYQTNVYAPITILQNIIPSLDDNRQCHIVNIGSMGGYQGSVKFPGLSIYSSSKSALANLTECLAEEYKEKNIKINCLALGSVQTEMLNKAFPGYKAQVSSEEIAKYIVQFSLQHPIYVNGKILPVSNATP
ncbi:MAG: SDR family oxidoreductase [Flavobacteriales bacterium]|nr:SDR family oxidoreductase [Flavobacteriales bacterium]